MPSKDWEKIEGKHGIYRRKRKSDPSKYEYLCVISFGYTEEYNDKTGKMRKKENRSQKIFQTLKEAEGYQGLIQKGRGKVQKTVNVSKKLRFDECYQDFYDFHLNVWSAQNTERNNSYGKRLLAYFTTKDPRKITTLDVMEFFEWCREPHELFPQPLSNKTIQKIKGYMIQMWRWWKLDSNRYGEISPQIIRDADHGKIKKFVPNTWKVEEIIEAIDYTLKNEDDYSRICLLGLAGLGGLRRGEIAGLQWGDILWDKHLIDVQRQRTQRNQGYEIFQWLKKGDPEGVTRADRKQRYAALPDKLADILRLVYRQQSYYMGRKPTATDFVYHIRPAMINGYLDNPRKIDSAFEQLQVRMNKVRMKQCKAPLPRLRLHDLRHSNISALLNDGVSIVSVAANSGHVFPELQRITTTRVYWHDDDKREDILDYWNEKLKIDIKTPDQDIYKRPNTITNRLNLRSDEL